MISTLFSILGLRQSRMVLLLVFFPKNFVLIRIGHRSLYILDILSSNFQCGTLFDSSQIFLLKLLNPAFTQFLSIFSLKKTSSLFQISVPVSNSFRIKTFFCKYPFPVDFRANPRLYTLYFFCFKKIHTPSVLY